MRAAAGVLVLVLLGVACTADEPAGSRAESSPSTAADATATTDDEPDEVEAEPEPSQLPAGPLYAPRYLPEGWRIQSMLLYGADYRSDENSAWYVAHRSAGGFELGGLTLAVRSYPTAAEATDAATTSLIGIPGGEPIDLAGFDGARSAEEPDTGFRSVWGVVGETHLIELFGQLPLADFQVVAAALQVDRDGQPALDLALDGWELAPLGENGEDGEPYELGLTGPTGTLSVTVTPGATQASLYRNGTDFDFELSGERGVGYHATQRIESQGLEFPSVQYWVPNAHLHSSTGPDPEIIVAILDSFAEVDRDDFAQIVAEAIVSVVELEEPPNPDAEPPTEGRPVDPDVEARLVAFIESRIGRTFDEIPSVTIVDAQALRSSVPEGMFVSEPLWTTLSTLGLVDENDDRLEADAARRERVRGVCCPVQVIDTGDPQFNEVVLVHELTHGLDAELNLPGSGMSEPVDPALALVEGNAHRVAFDYAAVLNAQGADIPDPPNVFPPEGDSRLPDPVQQILEFPYDEGLQFAEALVAVGGEQAIVEAFGRPPTTSEQILDLEAFLADEQPTVVDAPSLPGGAEPTHQGTLGAYLVLLMTEPEIGTEAARALAVAWAGDRFVLFERSTDACIAAVIEFDTERDASSFESAVRIDTADVTRSRSTVEIRNCVPSPD